MYIAYKPWGSAPNNPGFPVDYPGECFECPDLATAQSKYPGFHYLNVSSFKALVESMQAQYAIQISAALLVGVPLGKF
jgi:hypothetical protein